MSGVPHFEWLGIARAGPPASSVWVKVLLGLVLGWVVAAVILLFIR